VSRLLASLTAPPSGRERAIWFDAAVYGQAKLLAGAAVPWNSPAELTSFVAKLQGMFRSDAILADVGEVFGQRAAGDAQEMNQIADGILESLRKATPVDPAKPVRYPGEQTWQLREENMRLGVPVDPEIWGQISGSS